jgi:hypothetical protein
MHALCFKTIIKVIIINLEKLPEGRSVVSLHLQLFELCFQRVIPGGKVPLLLHYTISLSVRTGSMTKLKSFGYLIEQLVNCFVVCQIHVIKDVAYL